MEIEEQIMYKVTLSFQEESLCYLCASNEDWSAHGASHGLHIY